MSQTDLAAKCQRLGWDISRDIVASIEGRGREVADFELLILSYVLQTPVGSLFSNTITWSQMGIPLLDTSHPEGVQAALGLNFNTSGKQDADD